MASESIESPMNNPGLNVEPDEATKGYYMQQTMLRIKDPKVSLDFYSRVLGMALLKRVDLPGLNVSVYIMGYENVSSAPSDPIQRTVWALRSKATVELIHCWGTENDPDFKGYHDGNSNPKGFGHIGIGVDNAPNAFERLERLGVEFIQMPKSGIYGVAFIKDPDGYWIEILDARMVGESMSDSSENGSNTSDISKVDIHESS